jgi:hypothetical protein
MVTALCETAVSLRFPQTVSGCRCERRTIQSADCAVRRPSVSNRKYASRRRAELASDTIPAGAQHLAASAVRLVWRPAIGPAAPVGAIAVEEAGGLVTVTRTPSARDGAHLTARAITALSPPAIVMHVGMASHRGPARIVAQVARSHLHPTTQASPPAKFGHAPNGRPHACSRRDHDLRPPAWGAWGRERTRCARERASSAAAMPARSCSRP